MFQRIEKLERMVEIMARELSEHRKTLTLMTIVDMRERGSDIEADNLEQGLANVISLEEEIKNERN